MTRNHEETKGSELEQKSNENSLQKDTDPIVGYEELQDSLNEIGSALEEWQRTRAAPDEYRQTKRVYALIEDILSSLEWRMNDGYRQAPLLRVIGEKGADYTDTSHHFRTPVPLSEAPDHLKEFVQSAESFVIRTSGTVLIDEGDYTDGEWYPDYEALADNITLRHKEQEKWKLKKRFGNRVEFDSYRTAVNHAETVNAMDERGLNISSVSVVVGLDQIPGDKLQNNTITDYFVIDRNWDSRRGEQNENVDPEEWF